MSRNNMGAFLCIHSRNPSSSSWLNEVKDVFFVYCALIGLSHSRCDRIGLIIERGIIPFNPCSAGVPLMGRFKNQTQPNVIIDIYFKFVDQLIPK